MRAIVLLFLIVFANILQAQNTFTAIVKDEDSKEPLIGANCVLERTGNGAITDLSGKVILQNIPDGKQTLIFSYVGYKRVEKKIVFPLENTSLVIILLKPDKSLETVTVYSTRTNNRIEEIPTRIEVLGNEEVMEETGINPGNISKLLGETSGIQVQHTSAISGNVSFRIQGLPGKYTQLLQDNFPMYGGFSSGLSLLQIPPLDLQQVEIVKGSASTLYGSDAIAGLVNLITKRPKENGDPEFSILLNQTHKGGSDLSSFYSGRKDNFGITMLASINTQKAKDISGNSFTDIPQYHRAVFSPKIFYDLNDNNYFYIGLSSVIEDRIGGDIKGIEDGNDELHSFYEENKTKRINTNIKYENTGKSGNILTIKALYGSFDRRLKTNINVFSGVQKNIFSELSYFVHTGAHKWVSGINFFSDDFNQHQPDIFSLSYSHQTIGFFSQDNWEISRKFFIEPGIRYDYSFQYGSFFLPRLALMYKFTDNLFTRLSGGMGYKLPTPFTDEAERLRYQMVVMPSNLKVERSTGVNIDFNFKKYLFDELFLNVNQALFITKISNPIIVNKDALQNQIVYNENAEGNILSKGLNTNIKLSLDELVLYIDYTYLNAQKTYENNEQLELTPHNRLTTTLAYEDEEEGWMFGLEAFYFGNQFLENGNKTTDYWLLGASAQKKLGHLTIALNVENILDVRQTRYENIVSGPVNNPIFNELYAPLDGFVSNIVLKFDLY
jgi:iron complex outermembrane receptor protein